MSSTGRNDRERRWVEKIQAGDDQAFEALFCAYHARLCTFARHYVTSTAVAKDLVQEVFVSIWERRRQWGPQGAVRAYLYKAVRNQAINYHQREQVRTKYTEEVMHVFSEEPHLTPLDHLTQEELEAHLRRAIRALPDRRRHIFVLSRVHRLTYEEIAEALGISVHTVHTQIKRALHFLRERLSVYRSEAEPTAVRRTAMGDVEQSSPLHLN